MAQWVEVQGHVSVAKKSQNTPTCSGPLSEPQTENENRFFFRFQAKDLLNLWMVWIALELNLLASCGQKCARLYSGLRGR